MIRKILLGTLALILLVVVGILVLYFTRDTTPVANKVATATPAPESIIYGLNTEESELSFVIELGGSDVNGTFGLANGSLELKSVEGGYELVANVIIDGETVDTGNRLVNFAMRFGMETEKYPYGVYAGVSEEVFSDPNETQSLTLIGPLEISGVTNQYSAVAEFHVEGDTAYVDSDLLVDLADFGVEFPESVGSTILNAHLKLVATEGLAMEVTPPTDITPDANAETTPTAETSSN